MKGLQRSLNRASAGTEISSRRVRYIVKNLTVPVTGGVSTDKGTGTVILGILPQGNILFQGAISYLQFSTTDADVIATWSGSYSIGSTANVAGNQSLSSPTTDRDFIGVTTIVDAVAKLSAVTRGEGITVMMANNTDSDVKLNLNMLTDDNDVTDSAAADFIVNGYVDLVFIVLGDD